MIITCTSVNDVIYLCHLTLHYSNLSLLHIWPHGFRVERQRERQLFSIDVREQTHYPQSHTCMNAQSELSGAGGGTWLWLVLRNCHGIIPSFAKARGVRRNNSTKTPKTTIKHICWASERERMEWKREADWKWEADKKRKTPQNQHLTLKAGWQQGGKDALEDCKQW